MPLTNLVSAGGLAVLLCICIYRFIIFPAFLSPLAKIPSANPLAKVTPFWILYIRYTSQELATIHSAHARLGPVIRLAPKEISINCVKGGIQTIYAGGFDKHEWYSNAFESYGVSNMFSMVLSKPHSARKRLIANIYSKSYLHKSATLAAISRTVIFGRLLPRLLAVVNEGQNANMFVIFNSITFDLVSAYLYGLACSSNMLQDEGVMDMFFELYHKRGLGHRYFWIQESPRFTRSFKHMGYNIVPDSVWAAHRQIEGMAMGYRHRAEVQLTKMGTTNPAEIPDTETGDFPLVYAQLVNAMGNPAQLQKESSADVEKLRREIASELMDHLIAGFETSGITLTYITHELSQRPKLQAALREELLTLDPPMVFNPEQDPSAVVLPAPRALDSLPLLEAIVKETLRLHAAIPGPQPRVTPAGGCMLGPEGEYGSIPGGVRISAQAWSLHRNADVFPEPEAWNPERWMRNGIEDEEQRKLMDRWFWAFGSGGRMCVGSNLAVYQIKHVVAALYTNFQTRIVEDEGIEQIDAYTAPPRSQKLTFKLLPW